MPTALKMFRRWAAHLNVEKGTVSYATEMDGPAEAASSANTWKPYYDLLSFILKDKLTYVSPKSGEVRPQLASELQHVQSMSEKCLLLEVKFPEANAHSPLIESWVEQVIENWEVLCGPQWSDADVGDGGRDLVGRRVLDVSKFGKLKFHSTY